MKVVYTNKSLNRVQYIKNIKFMYLTKLIKIECELEKLDYAIELLKIKNKDFNLKNISKIENKWNLELENYEIEKYARGIFLDEDENIGDIRTLGNYETYWNDIEKYYKFFNDNIKLKILIDEKVEKIKKYELLGVEIKKEEERIELKFEKKNMITALEIWSCIEPLPSENTSLFIIENKHAEISKLDKRDAFNLAEKENFEKAKIIIIFKNIFDWKEINTTLIFKVSNNKSEIEELEEILKKK